ncbi:tetratricopeptide repeat protein [Tenacibaculum finnmarkense]|uniref:tetratricopeptide repeat protein n=1 Tax=Tenacibaculum finnmarkense TaxID=2781243 RepID=UPI003BB532B3
MNIKTINSLIKVQKYSDALVILLSLNSDEILEISQQLSIDSLFFNYFSSNKEKLGNLGQKLCSKFPNEFVRGIRTSQIFLKQERFNNLSNYHLGTLDIHKKIWSNLNQRDKYLWNIIQENLSEVLTIDIHKVLTEVIFWLENERYNNNDKKYLFELASIYNFFINLYLHEKKESINIQKDDFAKIFFESFAKNFKKPAINESISKLLTSIAHWIDFKNNILNAYSFDLNITPVELNGVVYFNQKPMDFYKWNLDGIRYEKNRIDYFLKAEKIISNQIENGKLYLKGNTEDAILLNVKGQIRFKKNELILKDLALLDIDYFGEKQGLSKAFSLVSGYSLNRFERYELKLEKAKQNSINWFQAYFKVFDFSMKNKIDIFPFLLTTKTDFINISKGANDIFDNKLLSKSFSFLSYDVNQKKTFNRFHINYDVWNEPFIKIGDLFFNPMLFFTNNDWFYTTAQSAIKNTNKNKAQREKTATKMEKNLADKFEKRGFKTTLITKKEANILDGDVDLIISENGTHLFIQLKRTYFRLNLKDAYYESMKSDDKASKQLNNATAFLKNDNDIYNITNEPKKWIVSTSYEFINTNIDNCNKINYFDLLFALENDELKSLNDIIYHLENDLNLLSFHNIKPQNNQQDVEQNLLNTIGLPLELVEPKKYLQPLYQTKELDITYHTYYNKSLLYYNKNDKKSIKLLNQCFYLNQNDIEVYGALGNCYANINDVDNLINSFENALKIIPNEPYIKRNYALALIENKKYYDGLVLLLELKNDYLFVGDFVIIFNNNLVEFSKKLSSKEKHDLFIKTQE